MKKNRFTIGRESSCDIPVADDSVSRLHAEITIVEGNRLLVADCKSSNGTFLVRGSQTTRIQQELLHPTDRLLLGRAVLPVSEILSVLAPHMPPPPSPETTAVIVAPTAAVVVATPPAPPPPRLRRCACGAIRKGGERCPICEP